ncbi:phage repressor protein C with HTH and peptisase S24 domain [Anseongella ginsenosidimutans]|uniref:Phage repressor protein C with HTH and peptisase S24 domain n=1 Tax=Anseongella ginsenosidimutans TaxID=496056 RepID=A0A4V2UUF0_9SPHI|nr:S24 family peptidase [Anseongella ginsenosidimutans]QEC51024.1 LexA family transcriptional regulator [Anseongella ginsenosidimutans]TCS90323.1 phage repressor protein C with HTH and peptisase S24 domain [Anseongella ginsenosidimutans]
MSSWERLQEVVEKSGLSINAFALSIGLKRAENLYQIRKGNHEISRELARKITAKYPEINEAWLLTGKGGMHERETLSASKKIPLYDSGFEDLRMLPDEKASIEPLYYIEAPTLSGGDFATICYGNSMEPDIPAGAIITLKEIDPSAVLPGEMYLVITSNYSTVKCVMDVAGDAEKFRLIPKNTAEYGEAIINKSDILRLFLVKGVISTKVL